MAFSDLNVRALVTVNSGCTGAVVTDITGMYNPADPTENPGGYAPDGQSTATRPSLEEIVRWVVYRRRNSATDDWTSFVPASQSTDDPWSFDIPLLDGDGAAMTSACWQVFLIIAPVGENWTDYDNMTIDQIVQIAMDDWAVGQVSMWPNCTPNECLNNANMSFDNAWTTGGCTCGAYKTKLGLYTGLVACLDVGEAYTTPSLLSDTTTLWYQMASVILTELLTNCSTPDCNCVCG